MAEDRVQIERNFGAELSWERLDAKTTSRIATYRQGSIAADRKELEGICD
jgi:hypothetical protein